MPDYPYPCPYCKTSLITEEMDAMGSVCPNCFFNRDDGTIGREVVMEMDTDDKQEQTQEE
jgi:hypothetical protein